MNFLQWAESQYRSLVPPKTVAAVEDAARDPGKTADAATQWVQDAAAAPGAAKQASADASRASAEVEDLAKKAPLYIGGAVVALGLVVIGAAAVFGRRG